MRRKTERPDEDELLAFLDGELTAERQAEIRGLCETDWETRARLAKVQRRIEKYVEATAHHSPNDIPSFDDFWPKLSPQLKELMAAPRTALSFAAGEAEDDRLPSLSARLAGLFTSLPGRLRLAVSLAAALVVMAAVALYLLKSDRLGTVSAQELLQRSAQAEAGRASRLAEPVVYRRLQVRRRTARGVDSLAWESWDDVTRSRFKQRVADKQGPRFLPGGEPETHVLLAELERMLVQNRMDAQRPLSAAAYARWREQVRRSEESVTEVVLPGSARAPGLQLVTATAGPHAPDTIIEASLVVRRSDWHAVAQRLKVQGDEEIREYELGELAYEVLPAQALTVFADPAPRTVATPAASPSRLAASPAPLLPAPSVLPTAAALLEAETAALYALHQAQADPGEQIEVLREADKQVVIQGLVETDARKQQLTEALRGLPLVAVRIQSVEEVTRQTAQQSRSTEVVQAGESAQSAAPGRSAFEKRLAQYFTAQGENPKNAELKIAELSNAVVADRAVAMSEAWALRRLAERFTAERERELTPASRQRIEEMLRHHVARLQARTGALRNRLEPVLATIASGAGGVAPPASRAAEPDWQTQTLTSFKAVERVHQLAGELFTSASEISETPEQAARQMLDAIARLDIALQALERQITREQR